MHPYNIDSAERKHVTFGLAVVSLLLATATAPFLNQLSGFLGFTIMPPSTLAIFGGLYFVFKKFVWKWSFLNKLGLIKVPDLNGEWNGQIKSSHDNFLQAYRIKIMIQQDWTHIAVRIKAEESTSHSFVAAILTEDPRGIILTYQYQNKPNPETIDTMAIHEGTTFLKLEEKKLEGEYYTGRGRATFGKLELTRPQSRY